MSIIPGIPDVRSTYSGTWKIGSIIRYWEEKTKTFHLLEIEDVELVMNVTHLQQHTIAHFSPIVFFTVMERKYSMPGDVLANELLQHGCLMHLLPELERRGENE